MPGIRRRPDISRIKPKNKGTDKPDLIRILLASAPVGVKIRRNAQTCQVIEIKNVFHINGPNAVRSFTVSIDIQKTGNPSIELIEQKTGKAARITFRQVGDYFVSEPIGRINKQMAFEEFSRFQGFFVLHFDSERKPILHFYNYGLFSVSS